VWFKREVDFKYHSHSVFMNKEPECEIFYCNSSLKHIAALFKN